jgi:hypothetical protein
MAASKAVASTVAASKSLVLIVKVSGLLVPRM